MLPLLVLTVTAVVAGKSLHRQLAVSVAAGEEECFFLPGLTVGEEMEFDFQVLGN
jgi:hypothetical protein